MQQNSRKTEYNDVGVDEQFRQWLYVRNKTQNRYEWWMSDLPVMQSITLSHLMKYFTKFRKGHVVTGDGLLTHRPSNYPTIKRNTGHSDQLSALRQRTQEWVFPCQ